jgi:hypothetical protein
MKRLMYGLNSEDQRPLLSITNEQFQKKQFILQMNLVSRPKLGFCQSFSLFCLRSRLFFAVWWDRIWFSPFGRLELIMAWRCFRLFERQYRGMGDSPNQWLCAYILSRWVSSSVLSDTSTFEIFVDLAIGFLKEGNFSTAKYIYDGLDHFAIRRLHLNTVSRRIHRRLNSRLFCLFLNFLSEWNVSKFDGSVFEGRERDFHNVFLSFKKTQELKCSLYLLLWTSARKPLLILSIFSFVFRISCFFSLPRRNSNPFVLPLHSTAATVMLLVLQTLFKRAWFWMMLIHIRFPPW